MAFIGIYAFKNIKPGHTFLRTPRGCTKWFYQGTVIPHLKLGRLSSVNTFKNHSALSFKELFLSSTLNPKFCFSLLLNSKVILSLLFIRTKAPKLIFFTLPSP